ncbi:MAG: DNA polymerase III subunit gamma/tau [Nitrospirae bacterium]|nr:DNA polymerase III subunit gamma/tau [Nitrospirota bacterium]
MSYQVLARKWRPQSFRDLVGQEHVARTLENAVRDQKIAHAYLLSGMRGVGKTSVARILAKTLNCEQPSGVSPCQNCVPCREITGGSFIDVLEIDGASNTGVDHVRELQESAKYVPLRGKYKIYIIDEVHMLSKSAFNALLKTLEEPPPHVLFIFATTEPYKIPATILCRCQHFHFHRLGYAEVMDRLRFILREEGISFPEKALSLIAKASEGGLRDALTLLDQILAYTGETPKEEDVTAILGTTDHFLDPFLQHLLARNGLGALKLIQEMAEGGFDLRHFCTGVVESLRHLMILKLTDSAAGLIDLPPEEIDRLSRAAAPLDIVEIQRLYTLFVKALEEMRWVPTPRFSLEIAVVRAVAGSPLQSVETLIQKLQGMEQGIPGERRISVPVSVPARPPLPQASAVPPARVSRQEERPEIAGVAPSAASSNTASLWEQVVQRVSAKKPSLGTCLETSVLREADQNSLTIEMTAGIFYMDMVKNPDHLNLIREMVRTVFGRDMQLRFGSSTSKPEAVPAPPAPEIPVKEDQAAAEFESQNREKVKEEIQDAFGGDPIVQETLRIFGGKVMEIHPREPRILPPDS